MALSESSPLLLLLLLLLSPPSDTTIFAIIFAKGEGSLVMRDMAYPPLRVGDKGGGSTFLLGFQKEVLSESVTTSSSNSPVDSSDGCF